MASTNCIRVSFEQPSHGWLPVKFSSNDFRLDIDASDVPINPVYLLYRAILDVVDGIEARVWWHLEPTGYYFDFSQPQSRLYCLVIKYQPNGRAQEFLYETTGTATEIILPFCRAIKKLASYEHEEHDWPKLEEKQLASLDSIIKFLKNET
ncbi:hypothetical protein [Hymenobacter lapidiphilus]|uniref:Uncharacterized protein n=1 Tax=Hymenobacter lapidiphilus TaxID=2608003 RepID=A0A7Y7PMY3_9BACT|nr:hypothetical protein [Hymenobacter lapidiphilus]NVO30710.1 hypothetical protein [Hymenobacter lapidiphilus]